MDSISRLKLAIERAEKAAIPPESAVYGTLCNARGALKPGGKITESQAALWAAIIDSAIEKYGKNS